MCTMKTQNIKDRFMSKVDKTDSCWNWTANKSKGGYGKFKLKNGKQELAHRMSYKLYVGDIPKGENIHDTCILHKCDNRSCVNPDHLFLGTQKDNQMDMAYKGRQRIQKIEGNDVSLILQAIRDGFKTRIIAFYFDVHVNAINQIKYRKAHTIKFSENITTCVPE